MKITVLIDYSRYSDPDLSAETKNIIRLLTGNTYFQQPEPTIELLTTTHAAFENSLEKALSGGPRDVHLKNENRVALLAVLRSLGQYIQANCNDNADAVLSAGYKLKKEKSAIGILDKPENFSVTPGPNSGSLKLKVKAVRGAESYIFQYALTPVTAETIWITKVSGKSSIIISGLTPGKEYAFRVAGKGAADEEVYSDVITHFVA